MNTIENVAVIGLGYIGLPTAAILAANGITVTGVDVNDRTIEAVNRGEVPFVEPDLSSYVAGAVSQNKLSASKDTPEAQAYIVAVPTPFNPDYTVDVKYIKAAATNIAPKLSGGELVILESTSPPGTTQLMGDFLIALRPDLSLDGADGKPAIHVAHCPERVLPGRVMIELVTNDRIVGGLTEEAAQLAKHLYAVFCQGEILITDAATAEMAKLVENSYRDVNIAFANELSVISDKLGINVWELIRLANHHPRVNILQPGPGVGGHCIAVDPWFIVAAAPEESQLIKQARITNDQKPDWVVDRTMRAVEGIDSPVIAVLGLAFKANIDDLRESPAVAIVEKLSRKLSTADLSVVEPHVKELPKQLVDLQNVSLAELESSISSADAVLLLVDHDDFKEFDRTLLEGKHIIDTRGVWQ
ncbi:UDP-N-acetyl-D-mannosamine dehydrogenase [Pseudarthrobacter sp. PS3-L1]|uniref:UDP-N-acetyl-D-mannosamine dehydrogenase n=1 Tax=Pseudarthrobacter sp. PS3-L1 TaxID=3046207 RepID=UPI0024BA6F9D|nr:UDP-N-acetyl-D-mannosamine dehydrogenase [Pseudarthrobacter sp. PS3-L1]MDJ0321744.1 UDP-N-acetyl-D-mannosamine dehydrogenase [Pseudarthrobacter sp. PS3-L1]